MPKDIAEVSASQPNVQSTELKQGDMLSKFQCTPVLPRESYAAMERDA